MDNIIVIIKIYFCIYILITSSSTKWVYQNIADPFLGFTITDEL